MTTRYHNQFLCEQPIKCLISFQMLVSPVLAGLAVAIGVPILLFYVYGVVPGSLL